MKLSLSVCRCTIFVGIMVFQSFCYISLTVRTATQKIDFTLRGFLYLKLEDQRHLRYSSTKHFCKLLKRPSGTFWHSQNETHVGMELGTIFLLQLQANWAFARMWAVSEHNRKLCTIVALIKVLAELQMQLDPIRTKFCGNVSQGRHALNAVVRISRGRPPQNHLRVPVL